MDAIASNEGCTEKTKKLTNSEVHFLRQRQVSRWVPKISKVLVAGLIIALRPLLLSIVNRDFAGTAQTLVRY
jgi:hypothetical protein